MYFFSVCLFLFLSFSSANFTLFRHTCSFTSQLLFSSLFYFLPLSCFLGLTPAHSLSVSYKTFLSEDAGPDTLVAIVHANDPDGDAVSYAITGGNEDSNFLLDNQKGEGDAMHTHKTVVLNNN